MSHTPGPWTYDEESNEVYRLDSAGHVEACLCEIRGEPNWRDNARLIAAAPDLVSTLREVRIYLRKRLDWIDGPDDESTDLYLKICQVVDQALVGV